MKQLLFLSLQWLLLSTLSAQEFAKLPDFGKVDKSELEMTECSFDKNAPAMVLFDEGESVFQLNLNAMMSPIFQQTVHRVRMKIFNKKGFNYANIRIRYFTQDKEVSIKSLSAQTYNLDASGNIIITKIDKATVYDKPINSRYSEKVFAFPEVKEGSVIEYKYTLDGASESLWYFQRSIPVKYSRFIMDFPEELRITVTPNYNMPVQKGSEKKSAGNYSWYVMENVPGLPDELYMSARGDYLQRIESRLTGLDFPGRPFRSLNRTWPGLIKSLVEDEDFGAQLKKNIPRTADLDALLQTVTDPYQKMLVIHKYVRTNMTWNNYDNIWALNGVKSAWKDKKGTSGEINLILINLLKDAGLKAHPVLVSTRENGAVNTMIPGVGQFNKVMAYVEIDKKFFVLDATEQTTPSYLIPSEVMASEGLVIEKPDSFEWGWKQLWDGQHKNEKNVYVYADINEKAEITGNATITSSDYEKLKLLPLLKAGNDKLKDNLGVGADIKVDSFTVTNEGEESSMVQAFNFSMAAPATGNYHYFSTALFTGFEKNPFVADQRITDVFFGVNQLYKFNTNFSLPDGYKIEELPKNIKLVMPDNSIIFSRQSSFEAGLLSVSMKLEFNAPVYSADSYPDFAAFYKKLFDLLNEKIVYMKK